MTILDASPDDTLTAPTSGSDTGRPVLAAGTRVIRVEAEGLQALAGSLDHRFEAAVSLLMGIRGRVIVTGMGKSGHVARKIAATFASTGTLATFVHPAEASHGDLGMIAPEDLVLALSNSGETGELSDILAYVKRFGIPMIGITAVAGSTLGRSADVALVLPAMPEACVVGMAPTTSTTMMLALGDALAVTLMEQRGFTASQFKTFHPGGRLGQKLARVSRIMHAGGELPLVGADQPMSSVILLMTAKSLGCAGVVDGEGRLVGIVTDGDLRRHMGKDLLERTAGDVMNREPKVIGPDCLVGEAIGQMNGFKVTSLFVVEDGRPVGIVHIHDCLRFGAF